MNTSSPHKGQTMSKKRIASLIAIMATIEALSGVTQGYVNPILPALGDVFDITDATISGLFVVSGLAFAVFTPIISRMGDIYGNRIVLRVTTLIVAVGAFMMAMFPTLATVYLGVTLLTLVVGFIPLMTGILRHYSPAHTRLGVSVMVGSLFLSLGLGALIAGIVGQNNPLYGFWVAVPIAVLAIIGTFLLPTGGEPDGGTLAWIPMIACSLGLIGVVTATSMGPDWGWIDARTLGSAGLGVLFLAIWITYDARSRAPFVNLQMFRISQVRTISIVTFLFGFTSIGYLGINNLFLRSDLAGAGYGFGLAPTGLALTFLFITLVSFLSSLTTSRLLNRRGERFTLILAALLIAACFATLYIFATNPVGFFVGLGLLGLGMGIYQASARALCVESVPKAQTSTAAGINELALSIGIAFGAAAARMIAANNTSNGFISLSGFQTMWFMMIAAAVMTVIVALTYKRSELDPTTGLLRTVSPATSSDNLPATERV